MSPLIRISAGLVTKWLRQELTAINSAGTRICCQRSCGTTTTTSNDDYYLEPDRDVGRIFIRDDVQNILKSITRFDEEILFARRTMPTIATPRFVFMTDQQLAKAKEMAYDAVKPRMQFPVVMRPVKNEDTPICYEPEIQGAMPNKVIFIDIGRNCSEKSRLMSVREPNGLLRWPTFNERSRMNNLFFPQKERSIEVPKLFTVKELLQSVLNRGDYVYLLDRACLQFEPNDPQFVQICCNVYNFIDLKGHYDKLRSTRHFGPMSLYLAYYKRIDNLLLDMLKRDYLDDAAQLVKLYLIANDLDTFKNSLSEIDVVKEYTDKYSLKKHIVEPALQSALGKLQKDSLSN